MLPIRAAFAAVALVVTACAHYHRYHEYEIPSLENLALESAGPIMFASLLFIAVSAGPVMLGFYLFKVSAQGGKAAPNRGGSNSAQMFALNKHGLQEFKISKLPPGIDSGTPMTLRTLVRVLLSDAWSKAQAMGGFEDLSVRMQLLNLDKDVDGTVSDKEYDEMAAQLLEQTNGLVTNIGLIGTVLFSILEPRMMDPYRPCEEAEQFFGKALVAKFERTSHFFVSLAGILCIILIYVAMFEYLSANSWMPNSKLKVWLMSNQSAKSITGLALAILCFSSFGMLLAVMVTLDPRRGFMFSLALVASYLLSVKHVLKIQAKCLVRLHEEMQTKNLDDLGSASPRDTQAKLKDFVGKALPGADNDRLVKIVDSMLAVDLSLPPLMAAQTDEMLLVNSMLSELAEIKLGERLKIIGALREHT